MLVVYAPLKKHDAEAIFSSTVGKKEHPETIQRKVKCAMCLVKIMYVIYRGP